MPKVELTCYIQRRRAQNRASQQAIRQRKEKHISALQDQLGLLTAKHIDLQSSYTHQSLTIQQLHKRIAEINTELSGIRSASQGQWPVARRQQPIHGWDAFDTFDAYTLTTDPTSSTRAAYQPAPAPINPMYTETSFLPQIEGLADYQEHVVLPWQC